MDRVDRRKTFAIGLTLTTTCHLLIGAASLLLPVGNPARPFVILILVVAFVASMQTFLNVAVWVYLAEIFPLHMRGLGIGISVFFGWTTNGFLALFFPTLIENLGISGVFFLFAGVGALALLFTITQVPETRGVTLEKLEVGVTTGAIHVLGKSRLTQENSRLGRFCERPTRLWGRLRSGRPGRTPRASLRAYLSVRRKTRRRASDVGTLSPARVLS